MKTVRSVFKYLVNNDLVRRVFHTFWQAAGGALIAGLVTVHSTADAKLVIAGSVAVGLAAVKGYLVHRYGK